MSAHGSEGNEVASARLEPGCVVAEDRRLGLCVVRNQIVDHRAQIHVDNGHLEPGLRLRKKPYDLPVIVDRRSGPDAAD
jgi:hypothetical protein